VFRRLTPPLLKPALPERVTLLELAFTVLLWQASVGIFLLSLLQNYLPEELGASAAFPGYAMATYGLAKFVCQTPAGWLADRIGRRLTLSLGAFLALPAVLLMMEVREVHLFLAFSALYGLSGAAIWPALMAHVGDTHAPAQRGQAMNKLNIAQLVGLGLGTAAGTFLVDYISYLAAFIAALSLNGLAFVLTARHVPRHRPVHSSRGSEVRDVASETGSPWTASIFILAAISLFLSLGINFYAPALGAYTRQVLRVEMSQLALMIIAPAVVAALIISRAGHLSDRFGRQKPLMVGLAVCALSLFALTRTSSSLLAVNLAVLAGLAYAVAVPAWSAAALDAARVGSRGLLLGALAAVQGLGGVLGQALGGTVGEAYGPLAPFRFGAIMLGVALVLTFVHMHHHRLLPVWALLRRRPMA
jgi:DHA1 family multidrug resistance protein-like MFS transporter